MQRAQRRRAHQSTSGGMQPATRGRGRPGRGAAAATASAAHSPAACVASDRRSDSARVTHPLPRQRFSKRRALPRRTRVSASSCASASAASGKALARWCGVTTKLFVVTTSAPAARKDACTSVTSARWRVLASAPPMKKPSQPGTSATACDKQAGFLDGRRGVEVSRTHNNAARRAVHAALLQLVARAAV